MKQLDKTALLFEMLLGTDMYNVNRKIEEVKLSKEYVRVSNFMPEYSNTQLAYDIKDRFDAIDIFGVLSMQRILEVEREICELDRRIKNFPTLNPYLSTGAEKSYKVSTVGDIGVEISATGMALNEFTNHQGVKSSNRKKVLKTKMFNWYKEAKQGLVNVLDNSKLMLSKIRLSKINIGSINFEYILLFLAFLAFARYVFFDPAFKLYLNGTAPLWKKVSITCAFYVSLLCLCIDTIIKSKYKNFPFYVASDLRKQVVAQKNLADELNVKSYEFEKRVLSKSNKPHKIDIAIRDYAIANKHTKLSNSDLFDYVYSEKEFYISHHRKSLNVFNVLFVIGMIASICGLFLMIIFK